MSVFKIQESTGANILLKQLGNVINNISQQFQIDINYIKGTDGVETNDRANTNVNITLSPRITLKQVLEFLFLNLQIVIIILQVKEL
jgi:hypothetical protein